MSHSSLVCSLGFSIFKIISSTNRDSLTSFSPIWLPFISFLLLTLKIFECMSEIKLFIFPQICTQLYKYLHTDTNYTKIIYKYNYTYIT
jgi:hypothetical protein